MTCSTCKNAARLWCALGLLAAGALAVCAAGYFLKGDTNMNAGTTPQSNMLVYPSSYDAPQTWARLRQVLEEKNIPVFAVFDHAAAAQKAGLKMGFASVAVFGSPAVGTQLMLQNPLIAAQLPLKILVYEDASGRAAAAFEPAAAVAARYGLQAHPAVRGMQQLQENLALQATGGN